MPNTLVRKAVRVFELKPTLLPASDVSLTVDSESLARLLGRLGYPGFRYLKGAWRRNPGEVLLAALAQPYLESRLVEALPWLLLKFFDLDTDWLVKQARLMNLTNRLGFVVDLAKRVVQAKGETDSQRYRVLSDLSSSLKASRLDKEELFLQESASETERAWLRTNRLPEAHFWHLLTDLRPDHLQYAE